MKPFASLLVLALLWPGVVFAAETPVEASMVITGTITVDPEGAVADYTLQDEDKVPPGVVKIVQRTIHGWRFIPIVEDGKAVSAKAGMAVRVVADMIDEDHATIRVAGAQFGCDSYRVRDLLPGACPRDAGVTYARGGRRAPDYPISALKERLGGEVFLVVEVGRDGRVTRADARQVNLSNRVARPNVYRKVFADSAINAARLWRFTVPDAGPEAMKDHWVVQIPIRYSIGRANTTGYGQWQAYIPGPMQEIPWAGHDLPGSAADAVAGDGAVFVRDHRFVLESPAADAKS